MNSAAYAKDFNCLRPMPMTDDEDDSPLEEFEEPLTEHLTMHEEVTIFLMAEPVASEDDCYAVVIAVIFRNRGCTCLVLEI